MMLDPAAARSEANPVEPTLEIQGDRLAKRQSPEQSRLERQRTERGAQIAAACGLFDVPSILSHDDAEGEIVFQYVGDALTLREHLVRRTDPQLMLRVGQALAAIHSAGATPGGCEVFWHGDYGVGNVLYSAERDRITVVDWANAKWTLEPPERSSGSPGFDLGGALIALFHHRPFGHGYIPKPETLGSAFLQGYMMERRSFRLGEALPFILQMIHRRREYWISQRGGPEEPGVRSLAGPPALPSSRVNSRLK